MQKLSTIRSILLRYGVALLSVGVAMVVRDDVSPFVGGLAALPATVAAATIFSGWLGGKGPAAVAAILGLFSAGAATFPIWRYVTMVHEATSFVICVSALLLSAAHLLELRRREAMDRELLHERLALGEAEEKFRAVAEICSSAIFIHDGRRPLYMNRASEELCGYTRDELLAGDGWQIVHPDYRELVRERAAACLRGEQTPERYELKIITQSGEERWLDVGVRLISFEGKPCILANAFEVTERKLTEEALRNREEHYRAAIDVGRIGTWEWQIAQNKVIFSDKLYEFTGIEKTTSHVTFERGMQPIHQDDRPRVEAAIRSAIERDDKYEAEFRVVHQGTDEVRWVVSIGRVLRDNAGNPLRMLGASVDITERRRAEEAVRNSEKLAATGRLAASIAHEINNPLEAVTNLIFLARKAGESNAKGDEFLAMAEEELRRAAHITKQTLGFYRERTFPTRFNVTELIDDVLSLYAGRIEAKCVQVKKLYIDSTEMKGMVGEIRQVISNLVANALDAMPNSEGTLQISVRRTKHSQNGSALRITIADNGMGISVEQQKRIFEPFFTTKQKTGTGLGLWLTKNIVEQHGGTIRVSSTNIGKTGTVFVLTLPDGGLQSAPTTSVA